MTIVASDDFVGLGAADPNGRTLDNGLGGSGTRTWSSTNMFGTGSNAISPVGGGAGIGVAYSGVAKGRILFTLGDAGNNIVLWGYSNNVHDVPTTGYFLLLVGTSSLRIRDQGGTDVATKSIAALSTSTTYFAQFELNGTDLIARILNNDESLYDSVSYTPGSYPSDGGNWGYGEFFAGAPTALVFTNFSIDDLAGGQAPYNPWPGRGPVLAS